MKRILFITVFLFMCTNVYAQRSSTSSALAIVEEEDGDPSVRARKLKFPNGSVTDNADGSVSVGEGSGSGLVTAVGDCPGGDCVDGSSDGGTVVELYQTGTDVTRYCFENYETGGETCFTFNGSVVKLYINDAQVWQYPTASADEETFLRDSAGTYYIRDSTDSFDIVIDMGE